MPRLRPRRREGTGPNVISGESFCCIRQHSPGKTAISLPAPLPAPLLPGTADSLQNFIVGLAIAGTYVPDIQLGVIAWLAAAAHEVLQELDDSGVPIHGNWEKRKTLLLNVRSGLSFVVGGLVVYARAFNYTQL
jgi:zinc and cadmium transporter